MKYFPAVTFLSLAALGSGICAAAPVLGPGNQVSAGNSVTEADRRVVSETVAAVEALGTSPETRKISNIVYKAVRSSPSSVLPVVRAAVLASPQAAAPEIVTAAIAALPDPWKKVVYHRITAPVFKKGDGKQSVPDFKGGPDGKQVSDGKRSVDRDRDRRDFKSGRQSDSPETTDDPTLPLAEAVVRTALDAQPGLSLPSLQSAADVALVGDPAVLLRYILSPQSVSGVGVAGLSNFANEPIRPGVSNTVPVPAPNPPAVSR